ncbi:ribonuclease Z [Lachnospiraceae bacterium NSJ-143]|nr:ribonuclease Z [Lachnospiraceae bacterium NSJ-143]
MLDIVLVGTGGMMPMPERFLSSMLLRFNGRLMLVDCGEGTQVSLKKIGWGFKAIDCILFTHYHADHISGLVGMLLAIANAGRTEPLRLIGPKGLRYIVEGLMRIAQDIPYDIEYTELEETSGTINLNGIDVSFVSAVHSVKCYSYSFLVRRRGRFDAEKAKKLDIPKKMWSVLQKEGMLELNGAVYTSDMVMGTERKGIKLTYCTDSRPYDELAPFAKDSDLFICEGMYADDSKKSKALENKHMLFSEAAGTAVRAGVKELWLTHFSPSLSEPGEWISCASDIFENTVVGYDGMGKTIYFDE